MENIIFLCLFTFLFFLFLSSGSNGENEEKEHYRRGWRRWGWWGPGWGIGFGGKTKKVNLLLY